MRHYKKCYPFSNHPIFNRIVDAMDTKEVSQEVYHLMDHHCLFMYPKIFSFSLLPYPDKIDSFNMTSFDETNKNLLLQNMSVSSDHSYLPMSLYLQFFQMLKSIFKTITFKPILIFDLRLSRAFDSKLINSMIEIMNDSVLYIVVYHSPQFDFDLKRHITDQHAMVIDNTKLFHQTIVGIVSKNEHNLTVKASPELSIAAIEQLIHNQPYSNLTSDKLAVLLDLSEVSHTCMWSIGIMSLLCHTLAHSQGVVWRLDENRISDSLKRQLTQLKFTKINDLFLWSGLPDNIHHRENRNTYGINLFSRDTVTKAVNDFNNYANRLLEYYPDYVNQYVSHTHTFFHQSKKTVTVRQTIYRRILDVVKELCENAAYHSKGLCYLGAEIYAHHIHLFIGDCGIGIKNGILSNYNLTGVIHSNTDALNNMFNLAEHCDKRRPQNAYDLGGGEGLKHTLNNIFACSGKFVIRTGKRYASFINPVTKAYKPSKVIDSTGKIDGTQYMILIPVFHGAEKMTPTKTDDFMKLVRK